MFLQFLGIIQQLKDQSKLQLRGLQADTVREFWNTDVTTGQKFSKTRMPKLESGLSSHS